MRYNSNTTGWNGFAIVDRRWAHYPIADRRSTVTPAPLMQVTFADGEVVRTRFATDKGKPLNVGRGLATAIAYYRARIARRCHPKPCDDGRGFCVDVPAIKACVVYQQGAEPLPLFPHTVSEATRDLRKGTFSLARVLEEARDRHLPLIATGDALDQRKLIERRYQRAAARHLLAHPDLFARFRGTATYQDVKRVAVSKDLALNVSKVPEGHVRNQHMRRPKRSWRQQKIAA